MKQARMICSAVLAMALVCLSAASGASATTLEVKSIPVKAEATIKATLKSGTSLSLAETSGAVMDTCTQSTMEAHTASPFTGTTVSAPLSVLAISVCAERQFTVDERGTFSIERIAGTTNGTVRWTGAKLTFPSAFGAMTCTISNTDVGVLTGVAAGQAILDMNAVVNCGPLHPSERWMGTYAITSPENLGVTS